MTNLNETVQHIEKLLLQEQTSPVKNRSDIGASQLRRNSLRSLLEEIDNKRSRLSNQIYSLPDLPQEKYMDWAEAVLSMKNLAIVILDTTGVEDDSDIIRVYAINGNGEEFIDQYIQPQRQLTANTAWTGLSEGSVLNDGTPLAECWDHIQLALKGRFIISFNLQFTLDRLADNIEHYGVERLPIIGNCLMKQAKAYFGIESYGHGSGLKLIDACSRIGYTLPTNPPLAADRAQGCLELLKAMSQGVTSAPKPTINTNTDLGELASVEDHPF